MKNWKNKKEDPSKNFENTTSSAWLTEDMLTGTSTETVIDSHNLPEESKKIEKSLIKIPILNSMSPRKQKAISLSLMGALFIGLFGSIYSDQETDNTPYVQNSLTQINSLLDRTKDNLSPALKGNNDAIVELKTIQVQVNQNINSLLNVVDQNNLGTVSSIKQNWDQVSSSINEVYVNKDLLVSQKENISKVNYQITEMIKEIQVLMTKTKNPNDWYLLNTLLTNFQSLSINANVFLTTDKSNNITSATAIWNLNNAINSYLSSALKNDNLTSQTSEFINNLKNKYTPLNNIISGVIDSIVKTNKMKITNEDINKLIIADKYNLNALNSAYQSISTAKNNYQLLILGLAVLSFLSLFLVILVFNNNERRYAEKVKVNYHTLRSSLESMGRDVSLMEKGDLLNRLNISKKDNEYLTAVKIQLNDLIANIRKKMVDVYQGNKEVNSRSKGIKELLNETKRKERESGEEAASIKNQINNLSSVLSSFQTQLDKILIKDFDEDLQKSTTNTKLISQNAGVIIEDLEITGERTQRLLDSSKKIQEIVEVLIELSQRIFLLSTQAALQAAKKTNNNNGFSLISEEMSEVSEKVSMHIQKINALTATTHTDITLTKESLMVMNKKLNEIAWNNDLINNDLITIKDKQPEKIENIESIKGSLNILIKTLNETKDNLASLMNKTEFTYTSDVIQSIDQITNVLTHNSRTLEEFSLKDETYKHMEE